MRMLCLILVLLSTLPHAVAADTPDQFVQRIIHNKQTYTIGFRQVDFYSPKCKFLLHTGNDAWSAKGCEPFDHGPSRTYLGQVQEAPSAVAIGYRRADGTVRGKIIFAEAGRGTTLEFDNGRPTHNQDIIGKLADSSFYMPPTDVPGESLVQVPSRRIEIGAEISYMNYNRLGKSIPAALEAFEFGFAPVFLTSCADMKVRPQITQLVIRTSREGCPYLTAEDLDKKQMKVLPDGSTGWDSKIIREVWTKVWPEYAKMKKVVMGGSNVAAGGGNESSVRMEEHPDVKLGWATPDYPFTHEFAHTFGGVHGTSKFEGFTAFGGYPHTIRLGGADVMRMMGLTELKLEKGSFDGFSESRGDDVQVPPYAAFDFQRFQPDEKREVTIDVLRNDYDYNRDTPSLVGVEPKTRRGRAVVIRPDRSGKPVVLVEPMNERLGFDMFRYTIADKTGFQSEGHVFLEALRPYKIYEAEDRKVASGGLGKPKQDRSYISSSVTYVPLGEASNNSITWKVRADSSGSYGLKFRYQLYGGEGTAASAQLSLSVNGEMLTSSLPLADTQVPDWWNYCIYPRVQLRAGDNEITLSQSDEMSVKQMGKKAKQRGNILPLIDYLMVYDGIDYRINFGAGKNKSSLNALPDEGGIFTVHENSGLSYGWAEKGIGTYRAVKPRQAPDPAMLAGVSWTDRNKNNYWEIEVPNGTYNVHLTVGGIANPDELEAVAGWDVDGGGHSINGVHTAKGGQAPYVNDFLVEGIRIQNTCHERIYSFMDCKVTVKDGRLTIKPGPDAEDPRLACLRISQCR